VPTLAQGGYYDFGPEKMRFTEVSGRAYVLVLAHGSY
jgi:hypothetical protein